MLCDLCNKTTTKEEGILVSPQRLRQLFEQGLGMDETNISMLTRSGMSRETAIAALIQQYMQSQSFWLCLFAGLF